MKTLRSSAPHVVFQECPGEVALCYSFYGCRLRCDGCHSEELWNEKGGAELALPAFTQQLKQYSGLITAVVFFGGEWAPLALQELLIESQKQGLKTCLYTGLNHISRHLRPHLDFAKVGPWRERQGGLNQTGTNQRFYRLEQGQFSEPLNHLFQTDHNQNELTQNNKNLREISSRPISEDYHVAA